MVIIVSQFSFTVIYSIGRDIFDAQTHLILTVYFARESKWKFLVLCYFLMTVQKQRHSGVIFHTLNFTYNELVRRLVLGTFVNIVKLKPRLNEFLVNRMSALNFARHINRPDKSLSNDSASSACLID